MSPSDDYEAWKLRLGHAVQSLRLRPGLPRASVDYVVGRAQRLTASRGETVFGAGDTDHFSYLLTDGLVRVECVGHGGEPLVIQLGRPGRLFGVDWLPTTRRRMVRAVAATDMVAGLITQETIAAMYANVSSEVRLGLMSYSWRTLSSLVVGRAEVRLLVARDRLRYVLWGFASEFGEATADGVRLTLRLTIEELAALSGARSDTVKHALGELTERGEIVRSGGYLVLRGDAPTSVAEPLRSTQYRGVPAPWARGALNSLLARCNHLGLNGRAMDVVSRRAALFEVPAGELLLPPGSEQTVAFVVRGSAWFEGAGKWGRPFTLQLLPPGRFVRLPTGQSSQGRRLWGRAHRDCIVALLTLEQMGEVIEAMTIPGSLVLLDATCRDLSRHVCDLTTAPTRMLTCRVLQAMTFLAHDFPARADDGVFINVPITEADIGRLVGVGHCAVANALGWLIQHGWIARVAPQRYTLQRSSSRERPTSSPCAICSPDA